MELLKRYSTLNIIQKVTLIFATAVVCYAILGFLILPVIVRPLLEKKLTENLHRQTKIEKVRINPFILSAAIQGLTIKNPNTDGNFFSWTDLYVNFQSISIVKKALVLKELTVNEPTVKVVRFKDNSYSFSDFTNSEEQTEKGQGGLPFSLNNIVIRAGRLEFEDQLKNTAHNIQDLQVSIPFISSLDYDVGELVEPAFSAVINGTQTSLGGTAKPFDTSRETDFDILINKIDLAKYMGYLPENRKSDIASGFLDFDGDLSFSVNDKSKPVLIFSGSIRLYDLDMVDSEGTSFIKLPELEVLFNPANLLNKEIQIGSVACRSPEILLTLNSDGTLYPVPLLATLLEEDEEDQSKNEQRESDLSLTIDRYTCSDATVEFIDKRFDKPVETVFNLDSFTLENLSNIEGSKGTMEVAATINNKGELGAKGDFGIQPVYANLAVELNNLSIKPFQGYMQESFRAAISNGLLSSKGKIEITSKTEEEILPTFRGSAEINDFVALDPDAGAEFVKWDSVVFDDIEFGLAPDYLKIKEIGLNNLFASLVVNKEGIINVQNIIPPEDSTLEEQAVKEESTAENPMSIAIEMVNWKGGRLAFVDKSISPNYSATWQDINGTVSGLTSLESEVADLAFDGKLAQNTPLTIQGKINPLKESLFADITINTTNIELSPFTPYFGKYVGYKVEKGKLALDLKYLVNNRELQAENSAFFDQFTLGETVESPDAVNLPINLAMALLKNRKGEITINIPVQGNLDDPDFSIGGIVFKALFNLIAKAATSPFALLGALIPEGEELQDIAFASGESALDDESQKKLKMLAKVLYERPGLKLDIAGQVDQELDSERLREQNFDLLIKRAKVKESAGRGKKTVSEDDVIIDSAEYEKYLRKAFENKKLEKTKGFSKLQREEQVAELEKALLADVAVSDDDLRLLAIGRATAVKDFLVASGQVEPERIFLIEPQKVEQPAQQEKSGRRADIVIK